MYLFLLTGELGKSAELGREADVQTVSAIHCWWCLVTLPCNNLGVHLSPFILSFNFPSGLLADLLILVLCTDSWRTIIQLLFLQKSKLRNSKYKFFYAYSVLRGTAVYIWSWSSIFYFFFLLVFFLSFCTYLIDYICLPSLDIYSGKLRKPTRIFGCNALNFIVF